MRNQTNKLTQIIEIIRNKRTSFQYFFLAYCNKLINFYLDGQLKMTGQVQKSKLVHANTPSLTKKNADNSLNAIKN